MEATSLRIGNLVTINNPKHHPRMKDIPVLVEAIERRPDLKDMGGYSLSLNDDLYNYSQAICFIEPIPLTKEILLKCGFKKREGNNICWDLGDFMIGWYGNSFATWVVELKQGNNKVHFHSQIKSIHQLQNLYFALTGQELPINL